MITDSGPFASTVRIDVRLQVSPVEGVALPVVRR